MGRTNTKQSALFVHSQVFCREVTLRGKRVRRVIETSVYLCAVQASGTQAKKLEVMRETGRYFCPCWHVGIFKLCPLSEINVRFFSKRLRIINCFCRYFKETFLENSAVVTLVFGHTSHSVQYDISAYTHEILANPPDMFLETSSLT
jgi:hypothetical protein